MAKPLALTLGEPAGIGPDITIKAWLRRKELGLPAFYLLGDRDVVADRAKAMGLAIELAELGPEDAAEAFAHALPIVTTGYSATATPGRPDEQSAAAALASIRQAVADVMAGRASAMITNPIHKSVLYRAGFRHPGHTEFLAELAMTDRHAPQPVTGAGGGTGNNSSGVARGHHATFERVDCQHGAHRRGRFEIPLRSEKPASGPVRP
jgi:4-hydroxythreonine-4-phosphate dehydrogenase